MLGSFLPPAPTPYHFLYGDTFSNEVLALCQLSLQCFSFLVMHKIIVHVTIDGTLDVEVMMCT
jgi:hypothetical protein